MWFQRLFDRRECPDMIDLKLAVVLAAGLLGGECVLAQELLPSSRRTAAGCSPAACQARYYDDDYDDAENAEGFAAASDNVVRVNDRPDGPVPGIKSVAATYASDANRE